MKDPKIEGLVTSLKEHVQSVNELMKELDSLNVDVRISFIDRNRSKDISQGISLWRIEEHNNYL